MRHRDPPGVGVPGSGGDDWEGDQATQVDREGKKDKWNSNCSFVKTEPSYCFLDKWVSYRFPDKSASTILKQNLCFILVEGRWKHFLEEKLLTRTANVNSYIWDIHLWKGCNCKCNTICPWSFCCASLSQINKLCSKQATVLSPEVTLKIFSKSTKHERDHCIIGGSTRQVF